MMKSFNQGLRQFRAAQALQLVRTQPRCFSQAVEVKQEEAQEIDIETRRKNMGVDTEFSEQKHGYVLTFPWNFPEIVGNFERTHRPVTGYWDALVENTNGKYRFSQLFREFH